MGESNLDPRDPNLGGSHERVPGTPLLPLVNYPVIEIRDRKIRVVLEDVDDQEISLTFRPYQALKITTLDCFLGYDGKSRIHNQITYCAESPWMIELRSALHETDAAANFVNPALHFTIPGGDDVLEVVAWRVEIKTRTEELIFPPDVELPQF